MKKLHIYSLLILCVAYLAIAFQRFNFPDLDHGDEFTDANVLDAGNNFINFGFINSRFLPIFEPHLDRPRGAYTHAPPLSENFNGILRVLFRVDSLCFFRSVSLVFSLLNILFWYLFIKGFSKSYIIGFFAAIFYLSNPFFIHGMDSLHESCYSEFLRSLIFFLYLIMIQSTRKRRQWVIIILSLLVVLESLATFEYIIYLSLFFILFRFICKDSEVKISKKEIFILLAGVVISFSLHFLQNAWYFGNFQFAFNDLMSVAIKRISQSDDAPAINLIIWWRYVILRNFSLIFLFNYAALFLAGFFSYLMYRVLSPEAKGRIKPLIRLFIIFVICGISWYMFFPSHSWAHTFVLFLTRHLLPAAALGFTIFVLILFNFVIEYKLNNAFSKVILLLIVVSIAYTGIMQSELPVTTEKIKGASEFVKFKQCLLHLKGISQPKDRVGVNYFRFPFIRYYTNRSCQSVFDKAALETFPELPRYFIFIPYNNEVAGVLFQFLKTKYTLLFQCNSARFPAFFFELKNS